MRKSRGLSECSEECRSAYGSTDSTLYSACTHGCSSFRCASFSRNLKDNLDKKVPVVTTSFDSKKTVSRGDAGKKPVVTATPPVQQKAAVIKEKIPVVM